MYEVLILNKAEDSATCKGSSLPPLLIVLAHELPVIRRTSASILNAPQTTENYSVLVHPTSAMPMLGNSSATFHDHPCYLLRLQSWIYTSYSDSFLVEYIVCTVYCMNLTLLPLGGDAAHSLSFCLSVI